MNVVVGKPGAAREPGGGQQGPRPIRVVGRQEVRRRPPGIPGGTIDVTAFGVGIRRAQTRDPSPVDGRREGLPDTDVVERRLARIEAVELRRERRDLPELRAEGRVVRDPRRVAVEDARVVEVAVLEHLDRAAATKVADELDRVDRGFARPVLRVRFERHPVVPDIGQEVAATPDEARAGLEVTRRIAAGRHHPERRARDDLDEVRCGPDQVHGDGPGGIVSGQPDGRSDQWQCRRDSSLAPSTTSISDASGDGWSGSTMRNQLRTTSLALQRRCHRRRSGPVAAGRPRASPPSSTRHDSARAGRTWRSASNVVSVSKSWATHRRGPAVALGRRDRAWPGRRRGSGPGDRRPMPGRNRRAARRPSARQEESGGGMRRDASAGV